MPRISAAGQIVPAALLLILLAGGCVAPAATLSNATPTAASRLDDPPAATPASALALLKPTPTPEPTLAPTPPLSPAQQAAQARLTNYGPAPELTNEVWINSEALRLADLRGQVVIVEFWTYG